MADKITFVWHKDVKILNNPFIMKQLLIAFSIPAIILWLILSLLAISEGFDSLTYLQQVSPAFIVYFGLLVLSLLIVLVFFRNRYPMTFKIDGKHAMMLTAKVQRGKNKKRNLLLILAGLLTGNATATGAGLININNNDRVLKLSEIKSVVTYDKHKTVLLKGPIFENIYLFCNEDNYSQIVQHFRK